uniref:Uncharacterized protein n=1 Tax=Siphoviridae sp. ctXOZ1 TaxID=2823585 RepID=A0A8S5LBB1_9CAUD|nr:MAG TPA: hypothetical protein [Siphoviridae sp. ctXOZ1]
MGRFTQRCIASLRCHTLFGGTVPIVTVGIQSVKLPSPDRG